MKLNVDCIRDILLEIEKLDFGQTTNSEKLRNLLPQYTEQELEYTCLRLLEADFLHGSTLAWPGQEELAIKSVSPLSFQGHQLLDDIREKANWEKTKQIAKKIGSFSVSAIKDIAKSVIAAAVANVLNQ